MTNHTPSGKPFSTLRRLRKGTNQLSLSKIFLRLLSSCLIWIKLWQEKKKHVQMISYNRLSLQKIRTTQKTNWRNTVSRKNLRTNRKKKILLAQVFIFIVAISLLFFTYTSKDEGKISPVITKNLPSNQEK